MKKAFFSVDLEFLRDIEEFSNILTEEPNYTEEIDQLIEILDYYNIKATFFACYNYILENKSTILNIIEKGHDIGLHSIDHTNKKLEIDDFYSKIKQAKTNVENLLNIKLTGYRAPSFNLNQEEYEVLKRIGFKYDSSYFEYKRATYKSNFKQNSKLKEFPVWDKKSYPLSGGAYLRLLPSFIMKWRLNLYLKRNVYYNFYIHPYDFSIKRYYKSNAPIKYKMFFSKGTKMYLKRVKWVIEKLIKEGYDFKLYKEEV